MRSKQSVPHFGSLANHFSFMIMLSTDYLVEEFKFVVRIDEELCFYVIFI